MIALPDSSARLFDAAVVGAGPAGSALARYLAREGWQVLLIDRAPVGRDRVCGGFMGPEAGDLLERLGLKADDPELSGAPVKRLLLSGGRTALLQAPLPEPGGLGVSRVQFDAWLQNQAAAAGAQFMPQTRLVGLERVAGAFRLSLTQGDRPFQVCARRLIRACGRRIDATHSRKRNAFFGCKTIYGGIDGMTDAVALHFVRNGHVGFNQLPDGRVAMCAYVDRMRILQAEGNLDRMMEQCARENRHIADAMARCRRVAGWQSCLAQQDNRKLFCEHGVLNAGDAVTMVNPIIGGGMAIALGSSIILGRLIAQADRAVSPEAIGKEFERAWLQNYRSRLGLGHYLGLAERSGLVSNALLRALGARPRWLDAVIRFSRPQLAV